MSLARRRVALAALLALATGLFAYAVIHERSLTDSGKGESAARRANESGATESAESPAEGGGERRSETSSEHARERRVLGVDVESTAMIVLAILAGFALAVTAASPLGTRGAILAALALAALAWTALDIREIVHQADESRTDLTLVAAIVAALHAAAAALAVWLTRALAVAPTRRPAARR
jgi:Flp pilus assembly protein TadB